MGQDQYRWALVYNWCSLREASRCLDQTKEPVETAVQRQRCARGGVLVELVEQLEENYHSYRGEEEAYHPSCDRQEVVDPQSYRSYLDEAELQTRSTDPTGDCYCSNLAWRLSSERSLPNVIEVGI